MTETFLLTCALVISGVAILGKHYLVELKSQEKTADVKAKVFLETGSDYMAGTETEDYMGRFMGGKFRKLNNTNS